MPEEPLPIPGYDPDLLQPPFSPAGSRAHQVALNDAAWEMIEGGTLEAASRLSGDWLRRQGWSVVLGSIYVTEGADDRLAAAFRRHARPDLVMVVVSGRQVPRPSAVFRLPAEGGALRRAIASTPGNDLAIFPKDRSHLLFVAEDRYIAVAGPPGFLRDAIDLKIARDGLAETSGMPSASQAGDWFAEELAHCSPFLLDGA